VVRSGLRLATLGTLALVAGAAVFVPPASAYDDIDRASATPRPSATLSNATISIARNGDFKQYVYHHTRNVPQYWWSTCVAASVQTELAIILPSFDTSEVFQWEIYQWGRQHLAYDYSRGLDPYTWAEALNHFSGGRVAFHDRGFASAQEGLRAIARAMRATGDPQGAAVRHGRHAWTIIGYTATADPAYSTDFTVTGVFVAGPLTAYTDPPTGTWYEASYFAALWGVYLQAPASNPWRGLFAAVLDDKVVTPTPTVDLSRE
jgi:hypothetical protein